MSRPKTKRSKTEPAIDWDDYGWPPTVAMQLDIPSPTLYSAYQRGYVTGIRFKGKLLINLESARKWHAARNNGVGK